MVDEYWNILILLLSGAALADDHGHGHGKGRDRDDDDRESTLLQGSRPRRHASLVSRSGRSPAARTCQAGSPASRFGKTTARAWNTSAGIAQKDDAGFRGTGASPAAAPARMRAFCCRQA